MRVLRFACRLGAALAVFGCASIAAAPAQAAFSGENGKIAFSKDGDLWTINSDGTDPTQITSGARHDSEPAWAPDGSMVAFRGDDCTSCSYWTRGYDGFGVYIWRTDGSETRFGSTHIDLTDPAWSPDAKLLFATEQNAFYAEVPGQFSNLVVANVDATDQKRIVSPMLPPSQPDWSPLGDRIALLHHYDGSVISITASDGTHQTELLDPAGSPGEIPEDFSPSWSPDGTRIAFSGGGGADGLCPGRCALTFKPDGTDLQRLSPDPNAKDTGTAWSPDGSQIAFVHHNDWSDPGAIWLVNADGSDPHFLTAGTDPDWQPLVAPRHLHSPRVGADPREGRPVAAARGLWLGTPAVEYAYQWALCDGDGQNCADIGGATDGVYTPTHEDVLHRLQVTVTATNNWGHASGTSAVSAVVGEALVGSPAGELLLGTAGSDLIRGLAGGDTIRLGGGGDIGRGGPGADRLTGGPGNDVLVGGRGPDVIRGGSGRDQIYARDGYRDAIGCGSGRDRVVADHRDVVASSCEVVRYG